MASGNGDGGAVMAHVTSQQNTSAWAKAGPMIRATSDPGSPYYAALVTPGNGIAVQWRTAQGGGSRQLLVAGTVPAYLMLGRYTTSGSNPQPYFTAYTSPDGTNWTAVPGSTVPINMSGPLLAAFAITSHNQGTGSSVTLDSAGLTAASLIPPGMCPNSWQCAVTWTLIAGSTVTLNLGSSVLEGLAVTSHNTGTLCTVTMDSVQAS